MSSSQLTFTHIFQRSRLKSPTTRSWSRKRSFREVRSRHRETHLLQSGAPPQILHFYGLFAYICTQEFKEFHGWIYPMKHEIFMSMSWNEKSHRIHMFVTFCNHASRFILLGTFFDLIKERVVSPGRSYMLMRGGRRKWAFLSLDGIGRSEPTAPSQGMGKSWWFVEWSPFRPPTCDFSGILYRGKNFFRKNSLL